MFLRSLRDHRYDEQRFAERALALLLTHWAALDALAFELIEKRRSKANVSKPSSRERHRKTITATVKQFADGYLWWSIMGVFYRPINHKETL